MNHPENDRENGSKKGNSNISFIYLFIEPNHA